MGEEEQSSQDCQWLEGRRYHDAQSYLLPNDIDELQLQHFILRYAIKGNYKAPLDSMVRAILDVGCGPGTWTMEMANEFPDATVTGIDMSSVFPTTIIPANCRFLQHNIVLEPLPFPDNSFDYVHQRLLVAGLKPRDWVCVVQELERVLKPGGWVELVEVDGHGGNNGPMTQQLWNWIELTLKGRGINVNIGTQPGLANLMEQAGLVNIKQEVFNLPTGLHGGKIGTLLMENEQAFWIAMTPTVIHGTGIDVQEYENAIITSAAEVEIYKSYHTFYSACGQKRTCPPPLVPEPEPDFGEKSPVSPIPAPLSPRPSFVRPNIK